jgi:Leucine-rich repeat (LRR) protein
MGRDGSDSDYLREQGYGFLVEGDIPSDWGGNDESESNKSFFPEKFDTFNEAKEWAKNNPDESITRSPVGEGFIVKTVNDDWIYRLWEWIEENEFDEWGFSCDAGLEYMLSPVYFSQYAMNLGAVYSTPLGLPRSKKELLALTAVIFTAEYYRSEMIIEHLPKEMFFLKDVEELTFHGFSLLNIPPEIKNYRKLTRLCLGENSIERIPKEIDYLFNLISLYLNDNNITKLPNEISNLINLQILYLNNNNLASLPYNIDNLLSLKYLNLSGNKDLTLTDNQLRWIKQLKRNNCSVVMGDQNE